MDDKSFAPFIDVDLTIDFSLLNNKSSSEEERLRSQDEFNKFTHLLSSWGCFQLENHGISGEFLDKLREVCKQFFKLGTEEKNKYAALPSDLTNGYSGGDHTTMNTLGKSSSDQQLDLDWNERLGLTVYPECRHNLKFWPNNPPEFKEMIHEYTMKSATIFDILFKRILNSLNIDDDIIEERYGKNKEINAGINMYPPCPSPEKILGLKPHSDFSPLTIVLQGEPGLQVLKDGQWFMVPVVPHALFVSIGDPIEIMSNGIYKSLVHKVVTNAEKARLSVIMFWDSDRNNDIGPLDELISDNRPQLYKKISHKDYVTNFLDHYQSGQRPIEFVKI